MNIENIAYQSTVLRNTLSAVSEQLFENLDEENGAILFGIKRMVEELDEALQAAARVDGGR
ncbi:MAG: hypothetical protein Q4E24_16160 [bacterium]|nr:hypothetical protein [bacterium]